MAHPGVELHSFEFERADTSPNEDYGYLPGERPSAAWHPKITPYRLIVLTTTIGLGTTKSALAQKGNKDDPITLEWVTGTVLFLLFFFLNEYEWREEVPWFLWWLFKCDCLNLVWGVLDQFSISRPHYVSEEKPIILNNHGDHPPITPYRFLVCSVVTSFGISKAVVGYYSLSTAVTWVDWALAVPIMTSLYCLGLYERNSSNRWTSLFGYSRVCHSIIVGLIYAIGFVLSLGLAVGGAYILWNVSFVWDAQLHPPKNYVFNLDEYISERDLSDKKPIAQTILVCPIVGGVWALFHVSRRIVRDATDRRGLVRHILHAIIPLWVKRALLATRFFLGKISPCAQVFGSVTTGLLNTIGFLFALGSTVGGAYTLWKVSFVWDVRLHRSRDYHITLEEYLKERDHYSKKPAAQTVLLSFVVVGAWALFHISRRIVRDVTDRRGTVRRTLY